MLQRPIKMTSEFKIRNKQKTKKKKSSFAKEQVEIADLYKPVLNNMMNKFSN